MPFLRGYIFIVFPLSVTLFRSFRVTTHINIFKYIFITIIKYLIYKFFLFFRVFK